MANPISKLLNRLPIKRQAAIKAKTNAILAQMKSQIHKNKSNIQGSIYTLALTF